jgi:hypothetical protein
MNFNYLSALVAAATPSVSKIYILNRPYIGGHKHVAYLNGHTSQVLALAIDPPPAVASVDGFYQNTKQRKI